MKWGGTPSFLFTIDNLSIDSYKICIVVSAAMYRVIFVSCGSILEMCSTSPPWILIQLKKNMSSSLQQMGRCKILVQCLL